MYAIHYFKIKHNKEYEKEKKRKTKLKWLREKKKYYLRIKWMNKKQSLSSSQFSTSLKNYKIIKENCCNLKCHINFISFLIFYPDFLLPLWFPPFCICSPHNISWFFFLSLFLIWMKKIKIKGKREKKYCTEAKITYFFIFLFYFFTFARSFWYDFIFSSSFSFSNLYLF